MPERPAVELGTTFLGRLAQAETAVRREPNSATAWGGLGMLYQANGWDEAAVTSYRRAIACAGADLARLHHLLGIALEAAGDLPAARAALEESLRHAPGYLAGHVRLAELSYKAGEVESALGHYGRALAIDPHCPEALLALARDALRQGDHTAAMRTLEILRRAHPQLSSAASLQVQLLERLGRSEEAETLRRQGRHRKDPPMRDPYHDEMMQACVDVMRLGIAFEDALNAGQVEQALAWLDRAVAIEPKNWLPYRLRAFALAHSGKLEESLVASRRAIELGGVPSETYPGFVSALTQLGRTNEAERAAKEGLEQAPNCGPLMVALAELRLPHAPREAETWLKRALSVDERDLAARQLLARLQWESGRRDEALVHAERLSEADPTDVPSRVMRGQFALEAARPEKAIVPLTEAADLQPANGEVRPLLALAWLRVGNRHAREGRFAEAFAHYDHVLAIDPQNVEANTNRARLREHLRRLESTSSK